MRAGAERLLARDTRMKLLVHDGIGVWCATRRLNQGRFQWPPQASLLPALTRAQFNALTLWACRGSGWSAPSRARDNHVPSVHPLTIRDHDGHGTQAALSITRLKPPVFSRSALASG